MVLAGLLLLLALLGYAVAALVLRADPKRWDNRIFAAMCFVDATNEAIRGTMMLDGRPLLEPSVLLCCFVGNIIVAHLAIEFAYSFPFNRRLPFTIGLPLMFGTFSSVLLAVHPLTQVRWGEIATYVYFLPYFLITLYFLFANFRRISEKRERTGIPLVMLAVAFRWATGMSTYLIARRVSPEAFRVMLHVDATIAVLFCYSLTGYALLRYHLFRVRGVLAEVVLYAGFVVGLIAGVAFGVEVALRSAIAPVLLRAVLIAIALIPFGLYGLFSWMQPRIERALLGPIDPRRELAKCVLERVVDSAPGVDLPKMIALTEAAISEVTGQGRVRFLPGPALQSRESAGLAPTGSSIDAFGPALPPALAVHFAQTLELYLHRPHAHAQVLGERAFAELADTPGELFAPVRKGNRLFGALAIESGELDRNTVLTAVALADHLALKLENYALFAQTLHLESQLEESRRLASLGAFAAAIAHDIRTPLTSVQMNVQILKGKASLPPSDMEHFDIALDELKRLNAHITEILDFAKPVQVQKSAVDLRDVADEAARAMTLILLKKGLKLERDDASELPPVLADTQRLRQVLMNLLDNAAQASHEGGTITLRTRITEGRRVALEVSDRGRGIDLEDVHKIFEPFFTTRPDGTGLGLAIAQKLIRAHDGEIQARSSPGEGATFTIFLPRADHPE